MNNFEHLTAQQQLALNLRLSGATYQQISQNVQINVTEHTLRTWFMTGGVCYEAYEQKKNEKMIEINDFFHSKDQQMKELVMMAMHNIYKAMKAGDVNASFKVIAMAMSSGTMDNQKNEEMDKAVAEMREIIEHQRQLYKEQNIRELGLQEE